MKNEEKLTYIIRKLNLSTKEIAKKLGVTSSLISSIKSVHTNKLRDIHLYAFAMAYNIPMEIFKNREIDTKEQIDILLLQKESKKREIFQNNSELMENLVGEWYMYSYPSSPQLAEVWETLTTFYPNKEVIDQHNNKGFLYIGKNQSVIFKESNGTKNITTITFDNPRVYYNIFIFSRVSKSNSVNKEMFNFGICSRNRLDISVAKEILGDINEVQLQMNYAMLDRVGKHIKIGRR